MRKLMKRSVRSARVALKDARPQKAGAACRKSLRVPARSIAGARTPVSAALGGAIGTANAVSLPFTGALSGQTSATTRNFAELAAKIRDLLNYDVEHEIEVVDTLFAASRDPTENDLHSVPVLIQYLARLPIAARDCTLQDLIPPVRAVVPDDGYGIVNVLNRTADSDPVGLIDEMYRRAVMYDSKAIADLTDIVLCYIAEDRQGQRVLPRLVSRFYELHLALTPSAQTLTGFVHQHALARLQVMRFVAGDPARQILHGANNARWSHIVNFATDLSEVMTDFETDILDGIRSYMDIRMAMFAANEHGTGRDLERGGCCCESRSGEGLSGKCGVA